MAGVVSFLLGPDSSFINGTAILVDGGMRMKLLVTGPHFSVHPL